MRGAGRSLNVLAPNIDIHDGGEMGEFFCKNKRRAELTHHLQAKKIKTRTFFLVLYILFC